MPCRTRTSGSPGASTSPGPGGAAPPRWGNQASARRYGAIYEDSPWVAEAVWPGAGALRSAQALACAMAAVVDSASPEQKLALIRAHPQLASRTRMADASGRE